MKIKKLAVLFLFYIAAAVVQAQTQTTRIAAAANLGPVAALITTAYEKKFPGQKLEIILASTGALAAQIRAGAPYDVFLSADDATPLQLHTEGLFPELPKIYAYGVLVMCTVYDLDVSKGLSILKKAKSVCIPKETIAPYGKAALEAIAKLAPEFDIGTLIRVENIGQAFQTAATGAAEITFVAYSAVKLDTEHKNLKYYVIPESAYTKITQSAALLKQPGREKQLESAKQFYTWLLGPKGKSILKSAGYGVP